jgi:hypothetical protein
MPQSPESVGRPEDCVGALLVTALETALYRDSKIFADALLAVTRANLAARAHRRSKPWVSGWQTRNALTTASVDGLPEENAAQVATLSVLGSRSLSRQSRCPPCRDIAKGPARWGTAILQRDAEAHFDSLEGRSRIRASRPTRRVAA